MTVPDQDERKSLISAIAEEEAAVARAAAEPHSVKHVSPNSDRDSTNCLPGDRHRA